MKNIISIVILIGLVGCAREEHLKSYKPQNVVSFGMNTGVYNDVSGILMDTIKISKSLTYTKDINLTNIDGINSIRVTNEVGSTIQNIAVDKSKQNYSISIPGIMAGNSTYRIFLDGINGINKTTIINLHAFTNWLPTAAMVKDDANKRLDFTNSSDLDRRFGGRVDEYRVSVNGNVRKQDESPYFPLTVNNGFTLGLSYTIKIEVLDNDGGVSAAVEQNITIN